MVFPGVAPTYGSEEDALGQIQEGVKKQNLTKVVFKLTGFKHAKVAGGKIHAIHRGFGKIDTKETPEGKDYTVYTLTPFADHAAATMKEHGEKIEEAIKAAAAAAAAAKEAAEKKEGEGEEKKEGEGEEKKEGEEEKPMEEEKKEE